MKVFELHFNPKKREEVIFDSFVFEPEKTSEKPLGNLYMIGEFAKILPQNSKFLNRLADTVKQEYYTAGKLTEALKKANEFLDKEARSGNVNWLGNLHFGALSLTLYKNAWAMNFSKAGDVKILLSRQGEILDIGQNLELKEIEPYPLKVFGNVVTGRIFPEDKIILLTKKVFSLLSQKNGFLNQLKNISEEKELKQLLKENKKLLSETAGICLLIIVPEKTATSLSVKNLKKPSIRKPILKIPAFKFPIPAIGCPFKGILRKKSVWLIISLLLILLIGYLVFGSPREEQKEEPETINQAELLQIAKDKIDEAEILLIRGDTEKAALLLTEVQVVLAGIEGEETASLQKTIQEFLDIINGG